MATKSEFILKNEFNQECVDISGEPEADCEMGTYRHIHYGPNQSWFLEADQLVSALNSEFCLGVKLTEKSMSKVHLMKRHQPHTAWIIKDGKHISMKSRPALFLSCQGSQLVVHDKRDSSSSWTLLPKSHSDVARPANSCHLRYGPVSEDDLNSRWVLECTVRVEKSAPSTYFCVVGWSPGGYSGIQQVDANKRVAIFSMWNDASGKNVYEVDHGPGVAVSTFGGEGTGLKSMKEFAWKEGQDVTFVVEGVRKKKDGILERTLGGCLGGGSSSGRETWVCSCWFVVDGQRHFMAAFKRRSRERPLRASGFYSFVEDWDRSRGAQGHEIQRRATFKDAKVKGVLCTQAMFTKVQDGLDEFAKDKSVGGLGECERSFFLSSGGESGCHGRIVPHGVTFDCSECGK